MLDFLPREALLSNNNTATQISHTTLSVALLRMGHFIKAAKSVEYSNTEVEICGKGYPQNIGQEKENCPFIYSIKQCSGYYNKTEKDKNPHKGEVVEVEVEEQDAPKEVEYKLKAVVF